jgi:hypothetical protein
MLLGRVLVVHASFAVNAGVIVGVVVILSGAAATRQSEKAKGQ